MGTGPVYYDFSTIKINQPSKIPRKLAKTTRYILSREQPIYKCHL